MLRWILAVISVPLIAANAHGVVTLTVDGAVEHQSIRGSGASFSTEGNPYPIPLSDVAAQVYALGIHKVGMGLGTYPELVNDDGDPFHFNWDEGPNSFNQQFAGKDGMLQIAKTLQDGGLEPCACFGWLPQWMMTKNGDLWEFDSTIPGIYDEVAEFWAAFLRYAKNNYGVTYASVDFPHEPDNVTTSTAWDAAEIREAIKKIAPRLQAESLTTSIITPNCCFASRSQSYLQTILADPIAAGYTGGISYHAYDSGDIDGLVTPMRNFANDPLIKTSGLPIWMTEWSIQYDKRNEAYIETLRYALDWAKFLHYCYAEGQCTVVHAAAGVTLAYGNDVGMFGPGLGPGGLRIKKFGQAVAQYSRFIEAGSRRIEASVSGAADLFVTAAKDPVSGALVIVILNYATGTVDATVDLSNLSAPASMRCVRTSATEDSAELGHISVSGGSFTVSIPGESVTTYVGSTIADSLPPSVPAGLSATPLSDMLVRVTWNASTDNVAVAEYKVFRDDAAIGITRGTSFIDHDLEAETSYSYKVLAFDLAGNESAQSAPANVNTLVDTTPPAVPAHLMATPRPSAITLTWDPSTDSVRDHDLAGFRVYKASTPGGPYSLLADLGDPVATGYTDTSVVNGQVYYYLVASYDDEDPANQSAYSNEASAKPNLQLAGGLPGDYYDSAYVSQAGTNFWDWFHTLKTSRVDATVDFNWEVVTPPAGKYIKGLFGTTYHWCLFGVRWQGEVLVDYPETYTFKTRNLDGVRLWLDGRLIIDDWSGWFTHTNSSSLALTAGWHAIRLDYYRYHPEAGEDGVIKLYYSSPSVTEQIIPADHLSTVGSAPAQATNPNPADKATNISIKASLSWAAAARATSYDVYFGTSSPPAFQGNQAETTFHPRTMEPLTSYFWRIDAVNQYGTTQGDVWSFATGAFPGDHDHDGDVDQEDFGHIQACFSGPAQHCEPSCEDADFNSDGDVDLDDFGIFRGCMSSANQPPDPDCTR